MRAGTLPDMVNPDVQRGIATCCKITQLVRGRSETELSQSSLGVLIVYYCCYNCCEIYGIFTLFFFFLSFWAMPHGLWDLSSPTIQPRPWQWKLWGFPVNQYTKLPHRYLPRLPPSPWTVLSPSSLPTRWQYSCLGNPMDREAWWATVHWVTESDMSEAA